MESNSTSSSSPTAGPSAEGLPSDVRKSPSVSSANSPSQGKFSKMVSEEELASPTFAERKAELEKAKLQDSLNKKIVESSESLDKSGATLEKSMDFEGRSEKLKSILKNRPVKSELEDMNIIKPGGADGSITAKQQQLKRAQIENTLEAKLRERPERDEVDKLLNFSEVVEVLPTFRKSEYNRKPDTNATFKKLTPQMKVQIREELNSFKKTEMPPTENEELGAAPTNLRQPRSTSSARKEAYKERSKLDDFYIETTDAEDELEAVQYANALSDDEIHKLRHRVMSGDRGIHHEGKPGKGDSRLPDIDISGPQVSLFTDDPISDSSIKCQKGACAVRNLYILDNELQVFIETGAESLPDEITLRAAVGDGPAGKIRINKKSCPSEIRDKCKAVKDQPTSIFGIAADSTLLGVISTAVGAWFTIREFELAKEEDSQRVIILGNTSNWNNPCENGESRSNSFRSLSAKMRGVVVEENGVDNNEPENYRPLLCYISRKGYTRRIINEDDLMAQLVKNQNVDIITLNFQEMKISDQIRSVYQCNMLMGVHHTLLAYMFVMKPGSTIIELFPYGYHKKTFENLAQLLGHRYLLWQNPSRAKTVFDWDYIRKNTDSVSKDVENRPIDWFVNFLRV
ncbi:MAG: hypothetical protein SGCHY_001306 [Lobulomycetales sp.]